ncbi:DNA-binding transcription factor yap1 [Conoideocrella luteorostrata]|uniref:DNA-binding transcription factor yap1 n=1 Tax=Conoideocrella luteorostrata TaxID=1105319 RepID=A0AAJ0CPK7_9HYPO|nr:DNA-binding transcription factor yap1 [Conoideocrella luteorostrata]
MASGGNRRGSSPNFFLTPEQQGMLFAALNANRQRPTASPAAAATSMTPSSLHGSPMQNMEGAGIKESPYLDNYDYDFGDSSFDFSFATVDGDQTKMIGDVPGTVKSDSTEGDPHEKRSHPDDEEDDSSPGNDSKRRESADKVAKKPGRKPLTSEPTSKRKAQNRAAQRAFRERKERHLKDLETKVEELESASEATNHENSKLRAELDRMTTELNQYKRLAVISQNKPGSRDKMPYGNAALNNLSDVSFQFEFPKFGALPGPPVKKQSSSQPISPPMTGQNNSPARSLGNESRSPQSNLQQPIQDDFAKYAGLFTPSMVGSARTGSRNSVDSVPFSVAAATSSPSASSNSNAGGPSSSCGTSPEPFTQSPMGGFKPLETLTTIGEEQPTAATADQPFAQFANVDIGSPSFDWLVQQNGGGNFDPQLFGGYREPQENVLSNTSLDDFFFNDGIDADFFTPFNTDPAAATTTATAATPAPKKDLIAQIEAQQNDIVNDVGKNAAGMSCNQLWEKLQDCPKAQNGEFDLDGLCSELTKKAKCSGSGPVVGEKDFDTILKKYMGKDVASDKMANKLGIAVNPDKPNGVTMP